MENPGLNLVIFALGNLETSFGLIVLGILAFLVMAAVSAAVRWVWALPERAIKHNESKRPVWHGFEERT